MIPTPDLAGLGLFVLAALVLLLTPGPAVLYIVARSIDQGRRAGLVSMLGVHAGTLVHIAAAAAGLSALLAASATAFSAVKYLGRRLPRLSRRPANPRAGARGGRRGGPRAAAAPRVSRRRGGERAQSQDGAVLPRLPPAVRRRVARSRRHPDPRARRDLRGAGADHRRRLRADGPHRRPVASRPSEVSGQRALDLRGDVHRARGSRPR